MMERLRELREDRGWSQAELAAWLNLSRSAYAAYERGSTDTPVPVLCRLADLYGTSVDYLLRLTDDPHPHPPAKRR